MNCISITKNLVALLMNLSIKKNEELFINNRKF